MKRLLIPAFFLLNISAAMSQMGSDSVSYLIAGKAGDSIIIPPSFPADTPGNISFPTAFRWNRSGPTGGYWDEGQENDFVFRPFSMNVAKYNLRIYNRSGVLIYESSNLNKGWDGYLKNGDLAFQGVYIWKASGTFANGSPFDEIGDVTFLH